MRAELPDTEQGRSVYEAVRRGDLSQMSFAFDIAHQEWDENKRERTITEIGKVYEISIVNRAAYPQTNVQARAGKDELDLCQYFGQKKLKYYADFFSSSSSLCCGVI